MLTKMAKTVDDILKLSPTSVTNININIFRVKQILGFDFSSISFKTIPDEVLLFLLNFNSSSSGMSFIRG